MYMTAIFLSHSMALSIKMNILLMGPGLLIALLLSHGIWETIGHLCEIAILQVSSVVFEKYHFCMRNSYLFFLMKVLRN